MPHSFLKISNDPWTCEKVDYWVPEKCGIYAGLYKTDKQCQPPPEPEQSPTPAPAPAPAPDMVPLTQQPEPSIPQKEQSKPSVPTPSLPDNIVGMIIIAVIGIIIIAIIAKKLKNRPRRVIEYTAPQRSKPSTPTLVKPDEPDAKEKNYWNQLRFEDKEQLCLDSDIDIKFAKKEFNKIKRENWRKLVTEIRKRENERKIKETESQAAQQVLDAERNARDAGQNARDARLNAQDEISKREYTQRELEEKKWELEKAREEILKAERRAAEAEANSDVNAANRDFYPPAENDEKSFMTVQGVRKKCDQKLDRDDINSVVSDINVIGKIKINGEPHSVKTKIGEIAQVCNAILEDHTGKIDVTLWGDRIDLIDDGDEIKIENSHVKRWNGLKLQIGWDVEITPIKLAQKYEERRQKREKLDFLKFKKLSIYTPETKQCTQEGRYTDAKLEKLVSEFKAAGWAREDFDKKFDKQRWLLEQIIRSELYQRTFDEFTFEERQEREAAGEHYEQKEEYTHYDILEVDRFATQAEIKTAYRKMAKKWHPDKHGNDPTFRDEMMKKINETYEILSDPVKRHKYDDSL